MLVAQTSAAQQQKFKVTPHDLQVLEGSEAVLRCEVSNLAGQVQWTKDGFALGKCFKLIHFILKCRIILSCNATMVVILSFALRNVNREHRQWLGQSRTVHRVQFVKVAAQACIYCAKSIKSTRVLSACNFFLALLFLFYASKNICFILRQRPW